MFFEGRNLKFSLKKPLLLIIAFFLIVTMLTNPQSAFLYASNGLLLWFHKMIPTLLPFMIITGILIRLDLVSAFTKYLRPIFLPLFRVSDYGIYTMLVGFLCGFPMGAKTCADLYTKKKLSYTEASYLLAFCNNIGPIYFIGFVLTDTLHIQNKLPFLIGMYAIPICYAIILRIVYKNKEIKLCKLSICSQAEQKLSVSEAIDEAITGSLVSIAKLGGYMVLCNLLFLIPSTIFVDNPLLHHTLPVSAENVLLLFQNISFCLLEITGGINSVSTSALTATSKELIILICVTFGGLSCFLQTYSMIKETDLSMKTYISHKFILTILTVLYYQSMISL